MTKVKRLKSAEIPVAGERFADTGDYRYVMLALGLAPADPPEWATTAARTLASEHRDRARFLVRSFGMNPSQPPEWVLRECMDFADSVRNEVAEQVGEPERMAKLLDAMFRYMFADFFRVMHEVTGDRSTYQENCEEAFTGYKPPKVRTTARTILLQEEPHKDWGNDRNNFDAEILKLERQWRREAQGAEYIHGLPYTQRYRGISNGYRTWQREELRKKAQGHS